MKKEYDFSKAKRGAVLPTTGKTRITLYLDNEVLEHFCDLSEKTGRGYQTLINEALSAYAERREQRRALGAQSAVFPRRDPSPTAKGSVEGR